MADTDNPAAVPSKPLIRRPILLLAVVVSAAAAYVILQAKPAALLRELASSDDKNALKVLFVGNSYTSVNDLPLMFAQLCKAAEPQTPLKIQHVLVGGFSLQQHWDKGEALAALRQRGPWDYVILQEQSMRPIEAPALMLAYAGRFEAEIKKAGARAVFYQTWARLDRPDTQAPINGAYRSSARAAGARVAPVGSAFAAAGKLRPQFYSEDGSHPTPLGSYLAACVLFATVLDKSPEGLPTGEIVKLAPWSQVADGDLRDLQRLAWRIVQQQK